MFKRIPDGKIWFSDFMPQPQYVDPGRMNFMFLIKQVPTEENGFVAIVQNFTQINSFLIIKAGYASPEICGTKDHHVLIKAAHRNSEDKVDEWFDTLKYEFARRDPDTKMSVKLFRELEKSLHLLPLKSIQERIAAGELDVHSQDEDIQDTILIDEIVLYCLGFNVLEYAPPRHTATASWH